MALCTMKLPDIGEGITRAELVEWNVEIGDVVREDDVLASVMTDKATVEIPATVDGKVVWRGGEPGDMIAIGSKLVQLEVGELGNGNAAPGEGVPVAEAHLTPSQSPIGDSIVVERPVKTRASPAVRRHAKEEGIDLGEVVGTGPDGRILHDDLGRIEPKETPAAPLARNASGLKVREIKLRGLRRKIAEKVALSKASIPHITIVEEVDVSALEDLRSLLNAKHVEERGKLTLLPFVIGAMVRAIHAHPAVNGHFDDNEGLLRLSEAVHIGIATQTSFGLTVPVVRDAASKTLWENAAEIARLAEAAREERATRAELTGSTITLTSLGPLGALATTPIINHPEIAIVGINKIAVRPMWDGQEFRPRRMMNVSCSFDHRVIDGWDAALFVHALKELLETPALLFIGH
ncbi:MAG: dihydrolipoamide acetyltransferase family protein [Pseudomonadota bacterium]